MATWKKVLTVQDIDTDTAFGSASNALVPSQLAVKTYVDAQVDTADTLAELGDVSASSPADGHILVFNSPEYVSTAVTGDISIDESAVTTIGDDKVTYAKMQDIATANRVLGATSAGTVAEVQVATDMIANDAVTSDKLANNIDVAGTLDVTGNTQFDANVDIDGNLVVDGTLLVSGGTTTISTTELEVRDKLVNLAVPDTAYGADANGHTSAQNASDGGGIVLSSTHGTDTTNMARVTWSKTGKQSGWEVADSAVGGSASSAYTVQTISYSNDSTAPSADLNGIGGLHFDTGNDTLYVRVS